MARDRKPRFDSSVYLPLELLAAVLLHLPCLIDRVYFSCVCRAWRDAVRAMAPPPQLPWLVLPSPGMASFFAHQTSRTRHLTLPEGIRGAQLCGSHDGSWVVAAAEAWGGYAAVNVLSGVNVPLPSRVKIINPFADGGPCKHPMLIRMVTFSAAPTSPNCLAAAHIASSCNIAFWRPGMDAYWQGFYVQHNVHGVIEDIIYRRSSVEQGFYVLTNFEDLLVYQVVSAANTPLEMTCVKRRFENREGYYNNKPGFSVSRYLVESRGKLLMVLREYSVHGIRQLTRKFKIFEMVGALPHGQGKNFLVELQELPGRAIFLGRGCSRAVEVSQFTKLQEGFIYYLDDTHFDVSSVKSSGGKFSSPDMGVYTMAMNKRLTRGEAQHFPRKFASKCSPPFWLLN